MAKPVVLVFLQFYLPGYKSGGPVRSVSNLVYSLRDFFDFRVVCLNRDHLDSEEYANVETGIWYEADNSKIMYINDSMLGFLRLRKIISDVNCDVIYLNSFFNLNFSIKPLWLAAFGFSCAKSVVLAPRGEFSRGALRFKSLKKWIYIGVTRLAGCLKFIHWQASSPSEREDIKRVFGNLDGDRIFIAPNFPSPPAKKSVNFFEKHPGAIKIIFLARISAIKNLEQAIKIVCSLSGDVVFDIFGPVDDQEYWAKCSLVMKNSPDNVKISYRGSVNHSSIKEVFSGYHILFLPTLGENFGHSIYEALSQGLPSVISDQTPWRDLEGFGAGLDAPVFDNDRFVRKLNDYIKMNDVEFVRHRESAISYIDDWNKRSSVLESNKRLFLCAADMVY